MSARAAAAGAVLAGALLSGCATWTDGIGYYWQSVSGHLRMVQAARPVDELLADPGTDAALRARLELAQRIRRFASDLPPDFGLRASLGRLPEPSDQGRET